MGQPGSVAPLTRCMLAIHAAAFAVTFAAVWGSLSGTPSAGIRRSPGRASAPSARPIPGGCVDGIFVRLDDGKTPSEPPTVVEAGLQLTATAPRPDRSAAAVDQPAGSR